MSQDAGWKVDELARELDMLVFELEQPTPQDADALTRERAALRRRLERARDRLQDLARTLLG